MATSTISNTILDPTGVAVASVPVTVRLMPSAGFRIDAFTEVARVRSTTTNASGFWSLALERNSNITPANSWYEVTEDVPVASGGKRVWNIAVGASDQSLLASLVTPSEQQPTVVPAGTTYLSQASADARYQAVGSLGSGAPTTSAVADAAAAGVATSASRSDHKHGREAFATPVATGDANAAGSAATISRSDHVHQGVVASLAWTAWSPVVTQSVTPTQAVGSARYIKLGRLVVASFRVSFTGAGTATNNILVTALPATAASAADIGGSFHYFDAGNTNFSGTVVGNSTTSVKFVYQANGNNFGNGDIAIANGDFIEGTIIYESAT